MQSEIRILIEHGEDTDEIQSLVEEIETGWISGTHYDVQSVSVKVDTEHGKTVLPQEVYFAIQSCTHAADNSDSDSLIREGLLLRDWLDTQADYEN